MPAITRSQKKVNAITMSIVEKPTAIQCKYDSVDKMPAEMITIKNRFIKYVNNAIDKSENYLASSINYYDNIRLITELYYYIYESVDSLLIIDGLVCTPCFQKLINIMYMRAVTFLKQIDVNKATTAEENNIINCYSQQVWETQKKLYPYVTDERKVKIERPAVKMFQSVKRKRSIPNYTGMDTIEPLNEYDAITNIWEDVTIYEDPDYEYETDEDDESEDEEEDEESEDEDESEEDDDELEEDDESEEDDDESEEDYIVERVSSNHIRFVY